jgi:antitoxin MazE
MAILYLEADMQTVVQKWGNSLGIRIPSMYVKEFNLKNGNSVEIIEDNGNIVIVPPKKSLDEYISRITIDNIHEAIETGSSVGKEEW